MYFLKKLLTFVVLNINPDVSKQIHGQEFLSLLVMQKFSCIRSRGSFFKDSSLIHSLEDWNILKLYFFVNEFIGTNLRQAQNISLQIRLFLQLTETWNFTTLIHVFKQLAAELL
jgi:hypothetical protein